MNDQRFFDLAMKAMQELVEKVCGVKAVEELRPLVASITHHRAVSRLRQHFAGKRGSGKTESLDARQTEAGDPSETDATESPLAVLEQREPAGMLGQASIATSSTSAGRNG